MLKLNIDRMSKLKDKMLDMAEQVIAEADSSAVSLRSRSRALKDVAFAVSVIEKGTPGS